MGGSMCSGRLFTNEINVQWDKSTIEKIEFAAFDWNWVAPFKFLIKLSNLEK